MTSFAAVYQKDDHTLVVLTSPPTGAVSTPCPTEDEARAAAVVTELAAKAAGLTYTGEVIELAEGLPTVPHLLGNVGDLGVALISGPSLPQASTSADGAPANPNAPPVDLSVPSDTPSPAPTSDATGA